MLSCSSVHLCPLVSPTCALFTLANFHAFQHAFMVPGVFHVPAGVLFSHKLPQNTQPAVCSPTAPKAAFFSHHLQAAEPTEAVTLLSLRAKGHAADSSPLPPFLMAHTHQEGDGFTWLLFLPSLFPGRTSFHLDSSKRTQSACKTRVGGLRVSLLCKWSVH